MTSTHIGIVFLLLAFGTCFPLASIAQPDDPPRLPVNPTAPDEANGPSTPRASVAVVYSADYLVDLHGLEKSHPFDIRKYQRIVDALVADGLIADNTCLVPEPISREQILLVHDEAYLNALKRRRNIARYLEADALRFVPFSLDKAVLKPFRHASGGTILAARQALQHGIGINVGGGYHHAKPDTGEGFCIYADVPIAIRQLQHDELIQRAVVIDVDVHQGNGTAECLADDDSTLTFSIHQGDIYPIPKSQSDRDVEVDAGTNDEQYLALLEEHLGAVLDEARADICFIVGGCDTLTDDPLASLEMTEEGIVRRDARIIEACVARNIPVVLTLSGGYSENAWHAQYASIKNLLETYPLADAGEESSPAVRPEDKKQFKQR